MKKIYFILIPLLLIIFFVILFLQFRSPSQNNSQSAVPTPFEPNDKNSLFIEKIIPSQEQPYTKASRNQELQVTFNKAVKASDVSLQVNPPTPMTTRQGASTKEVFISPTFPGIWEPNRLYTIRITTQTKSEDDMFLYQEKVYTLQSTVVAEPDIDEHLGR